jgi:hypothetical protein
MKFRIKALDSNKLLEVIEFFETQGYTLYNGDEHSIMLTKIFPKGQYNKNGTNAYMIYINEYERLAEKYPVTYSYESKEFRNFEYANIPFTKEELKILDTFDYDLAPNHIKDTKQQITDWINN